MRVLITGMGGELGSRVAQLLEADERVTELSGLDFVPPRRLLRRSRFRRVDLSGLDAAAEFVAEMAPEVVLHLGVYEPHARSSPAGAAERTSNTTVAVLGAAARTQSLRHVVVRSGIEVYGWGRGRPSVPDELVPPDPSSLFGRICLEAERVAAATSRRLDIPLTTLRLAPVVGSHVPSPLGRLLRLPVVPVSLVADPPYCMVHLEDAARAFATVALGDRGGVLNVVAPGAATPWQTVRLGGRIPLPVAAGGWEVARRVTELAGAPVPSHVVELLRHGRTADGARARGVLGLQNMHAAQAILGELFEWASVTPITEARIRVA